MTIPFTWKDGAIAVLVVALFLMFMWNRSVRQTLEETYRRVYVAETELSRIKTELSQHTESITEITKKPDGTTVTKITKIEDKTKVSEENADRKKVGSEIVKTKVVKNDRSRYLVYSLFDVSKRPAWSSDRFNVGVGARIGDLPVFGIVSGRRTEDGFVTSAGVQLEW